MAARTHFGGGGWGGAGVGGVFFAGGEGAALIYHTDRGEGRAYMHTHTTNHQH